MTREMQEEQKHFNGTRKLIRDNVNVYKKKAVKLKKESDELYRAVQQGDAELYNQLMASLSIKEHTQDTLEKNEKALDKPYFGRVDFKEIYTKTEDSLYIGKYGISKEQEVIVVDWRAPVSKVYYENEMGEGEYQIPGGDQIYINLNLKRTYDTGEGKLHGFYDNDVASNDELLVKYLAKNKDAVLGDIVATIQKEQNEIIRDHPFKNIIVQGVAGSGKTTVAMHRISYILYNYEERFQANAFCIIGSNDMLLSYITSGLPELDVKNIKYQRMDLFFAYLLGKDWKAKYKIKETGSEGCYKSGLAFALSLDKYLKSRRDQLLSFSTIRDAQLGTIFSAQHLTSVMELCERKSVAQTAAILNDRLKTKISFLIADEDKEYVQKKCKEYKKYFDPLNGEIVGVKLYVEFLEKYSREQKICLEETIQNVKKGLFDVYDLAAFVLIQKRMTAKKDYEEFSQIIVDEAQDFGEMVYYVQKQVLDDCYFTFMGDVSQNINYETGMNSWNDLKTVFIDEKRDRFSLLAKSYRNTIEISEFAGKVLERASAGEYKIQPVIRHGEPVKAYIEKEEDLAKKTACIIQEIKTRGYDTIAVICRTAEEALLTEEKLKPHIQESEKEELEKQGFQKGVMILPIELTKGLEFDAVILWKPQKEYYGENVKEAKLLYVAITRALHELYLIGDKELSPLLR